MGPACWSNPRTATAAVVQATRTAGERHPKVPTARTGSSCCGPKKEPTTVDKNGSVKTNARPAAERTACFVEQESSCKTDSVERGEEERQPPRLSRKKSVCDMKVSAKA